jgi:hypothetical protein
MVSFAKCNFDQIQLTGKRQPYPCQYTKLEAEDVEDKVPVVVVRHAIVHPRTVTVRVSLV